ncbi:MAG: PLP-dependent lyase/thiolase [Pirellulales bacterium]
MLPTIETPLIRLSNLCPGRQVHAKCEFLQRSGCFKLRGAKHLLERLEREGRKPPLVVPSMGNTAIGAAVAAREYGFRMLGVVPQSISAAKDRKLRELGVELVKIDGGGKELLETATRLAAEQDAYFVHPHLDPMWTDGYQEIVEQVLQAIPGLKSLVFPLGGGGLLMGITDYLSQHAAGLALYACEPYNYPTYARHDHARSKTIADGLMLDQPHAKVQERIAELNIPVHLVSEAEIRTAMKDLYQQQGLLVEPSSAITTALVASGIASLEEPICVVLTGANIADDDFYRLIS